MENFVDLHIHTIYSDGILTPQEIIQQASQIGLEAVAITDHDSVDGLEDATEEGRKLGVDVIPGIELTAYDEKDFEFHILGYFINYQSEDLKKFLEESKKERRIRAEKIVEKLKALGFEVIIEEVDSQAKGVITLPLIAKTVVLNGENQERLVEEFGKIPDLGTFIRSYLIEGKSAYVKSRSLDPKTVIDLIHSVKGVAVLAHPCWGLAQKEADTFLFDQRCDLDKLVSYGLDGLEVYAHRDNEKDTKKCVEYFEKVAEEKGLLITGGSDFHGHTGLGKSLGFVDFYLKVPVDLLNKMKKKSLVDKIG